TRSSARSATLRSRRWRRGRGRSRRPAPRPPRRQSRKRWWHRRRRRQNSSRSRRPTPRRRARRPARPRRRKAPRRTSRSRMKAWTTTPSSRSRKRATRTSPTSSATSRTRRSSSALSPADRANRRAPWSEAVGFVRILQRSRTRLIPTPRPAWGHSSVGRAVEWHSRGQGFDSPWLHQFLSFDPDRRCDLLVVFRLHAPSVQSRAQRRLTAEPAALRRGGARGHAPRVLVEPEAADALMHGLRLLLQRLGGCSTLLDQRRVLLRRLVHARQGSIDVIDPGRLLAARRGDRRYDA